MTSNPYDPPAEPKAFDGPAPQVGIVLYLAAIALMLTGVIACATSLQQMIFVPWRSWVWVVPPLFGALGLGEIVCAAFLTRGSAAAATAGLLLSAIMGLTASAWVFMTLWSGILSPLVLIWFLSCAPPVLLVPASLPSALAVTRYKRALRTL